MGSYFPPVLVTVTLTPPQTTMTFPAQTAVCDWRAVGAPVVEFGVQLSIAGSYRPPVLRFPPNSAPPQTTITLPVQTAVWSLRAFGAAVVAGGVQLSLVGACRPPVFKEITLLIPPPTTITPPGHNPGRD